ncbi:DUF499 domain-containing protein [Hymenobacter sp. 102]|uniref:DUF499 domain-containing protein n=1 Tax=Hymenobacter sp. 102 TaxID=3403152 RepID=UPI003CED63DE
MPISQFQQDNLYKSLGLFIDGFRPYAVSVLQRHYGETWPGDFVRGLSEGQRKSWNDGQRAGTLPENLLDFQYLPSFSLQLKEILRNDFQRTVNKLPTWLGEITDVRHKIAHFQPIDEDDASKAWIHMKAIAKQLGMSELEVELQKLQTLTPATAAVATPVVAAPSGPRAWFHVVTPHLDIREGRLDESVFAANLTEVALGTGRAMYTNSGLFFSKTYFTQGLKSVARRVIQGLNGAADAENRVMSLQTGFGGGKTHTLISLLHLCRLGSRAATSADTAELVAATGTPNFQQASIAVFTNATNDPARGRNPEDGIHLQTIWGELAYQLAGRDGYELVRPNDEQLIAPAGLFTQVLALAYRSKGPSLILIDELADYCVKASARIVGGSTLSDQTISFVQELTEAVAGTNHCVAVITLPVSPQEVGNTPQAQQILESLQKRVSRVGSDTQPVADEEIFEVIRRRLFDELGSTSLHQAALDQYESLYQQSAADLPRHANSSEYRALMHKAYPFHPELIDVFRLRWASHHNFQRTRGALRLLAAILSDLWKRHQSLPGQNLIIHTSDARLQNLDPITGKIKELYGSGYDAVITADVAGSSSNAFKIDQARPEYRQWELTQGIAATVLLNSFGRDNSNKGLSIPEIKLNVLKPAAYNPNTVNSALDELEEHAHYLYYTQSGSSRRYWFHTKPNINILINQAKNEIKDPAVNADILRRIEEKRRLVQVFNLLPNPLDDVPEQQRPTLIVLHPDYSVATGGSPDKDTVKHIQAMATKRGNSERIFRNTLLFLLCNTMGATKLRADVRDYLACQNTISEYSSQLEKEQKEELKRRSDDCAREIESSLVKAYSVVVKYSIKGGAEHLSFKEFSSALDNQLNQNLPALLKEEEWLLDSVGYQTLGRHNLLPTPEQPLRTREVYEAFLRFDDKPMITKVAAVQDSLLRYCQQGQLAIAAGDGITFSKIYLGELVPMFDVTDQTYWLVDKSLKPADTPTLQSGPTPDPGYQPGGVPPTPGQQPDPNPSPNGSSVYRSVTVSGKVPLENYNQLFTSFILPLAKNNVEIEIIIKGRSTASNPLTENSPEYKVIKESARQLGLSLDVE